MVWVTYKLTFLCLNVLHRDNYEVNVRILIWFMLLCYVLVRIFSLKTQLFIVQKPSESSWHEKNPLDVCGWVVFPYGRWTVATRNVPCGRLFGGIYFLSFWKIWKVIATIDVSRLGGWAWKRNIFWTFLVLTWTSPLNNVQKSFLLNRYVLLPNLKTLKKLSLCAWQTI